MAVIKDGVIVLTKVENDAVLTAQAEVSHKHYTDGVSSDACDADYRCRLIGIFGQTFVDSYMSQSLRMTVEE